MEETAQENQLNRILEEVRTNSEKRVKTVLAELRRQLEDEERTTADPLWQFRTRALDKPQ